MPFQATRLPVPGQSVDADWRSQGACRDHHPDLFFPSDDAPAELVRVQEATAKAVCRSCPVAGRCLSAALAGRISYGVWGALSADDRRAILAARSGMAPTPEPSPAVHAVPARPVSARRRRCARTSGVVRCRPVAIPPQPQQVSA
jgi:WhiB family redox-sensing transcriptional regulator